MKNKIYSIAGDASYRKYFRMLSKKQSQILLYCNKEKFKNIAIYDALNKYLRKNNIYTPKTFYHDYKNGILVLEDLGDLSYYKFLIKKKNKLNGYKKIIKVLLKIQKIKLKNSFKTITNHNYRIEKYSIKKLEEESDLFFEWYLPLVLNKKKLNKVKPVVKKILSNLYKKINLPNSVFVHRDFHVLNIMKVKKKIGIIDTQDAIIGNPAYDLVSLIDDVRIKTSINLKKKIFNYYIENCPKFYKKNIKFFKEDFDILSIQRSLKIIGVFARLSIRDKKDVYLKLIPYTWKILQNRLKNKNFKKLSSILNRNVSNKIRNKTNFI